MLTAGHQAETEFGFVEHHGYHDHGNHRNQHEPVELKALDVHDEHLSCADVFDLRGVVIRIGGGVDGLDKNRGGGGAQQVQGRTDQGLVRLEVDAGHAQQRGVSQPEKCGGEENGHNHQEGRSSGAVTHHEGASQRADYHDALKPEVDDTGVFRDTAAQRDQSQDGSEDQGVLNEQQHYLSPSFPEAAAAASAALNACAFLSALFARMLFMVILINRTKPQR